MSSKKNYTQSLPKNQAERHRQTKTQLLKCILDRRLTDALEILEKLGFTGDLALFIIAAVNSGRVAL